jgi:hypothetical protein
MNRLMESKSMGNLRKGDRTTSKKFSNVMFKGIDKKLQGEYIQGLQEEIKYLEYELKLLKDKDSTQNANLNQLESFFNDGIPINENILALKNMFNKTKTDLEDKVKAAGGEIERKSKLRDELQVELQKLKNTITLLLKGRTEAEELFLKQQVDIAREQQFHKLKI